MYIYVGTRAPPSTIHSLEACVRVGDNTRIAPGICADWPEFCCLVGSQSVFEDIHVRRVGVRRPPRRICVCWACVCVFVCLCVCVCQQRKGRETCVSMGFPENSSRSMGMPRVRGRGGRERKREACTIDGRERVCARGQKRGIYLNWVPTEQRQGDVGEHGVAGKQQPQYGHAQSQGLVRSAEQRRYSVLLVKPAGKCA